MQLQSKVCYMQSVPGVSLITVRPVLVQLIKHSPFVSGQFHIWCRCCLQVPQQTRFGLNMQSSPGIVTSARSALPLITYIASVPVLEPMHFFRLYWLDSYTVRLHRGGNMDTNNIITQHNPSRLSKTVTSFSPKGSLSLCSLPPTTVESLITPEGWCLWTRHWCAPSR